MIIIEKQGFRNPEARFLLMQVNKENEQTKKESCNDPIAL
jgi:hypothetical protein